MSNVYESIMIGINEALEDANGELVLKRHKVTVEPTIIKEPEERKEDSSRMSQKTCANNMEVSDK